MVQPYMCVYVSTAQKVGHHPLVRHESHRLATRFSQRDGLKTVSIIAKILEQFQESIR